MLSDLPVLSVLARARTEVDNMGEGKREARGREGGMAVRGMESASIPCESLVVQQVFLFEPCGSRIPSTMPSCMQHSNFYHGLGF